MTDSIHIRPEPVAWMYEQNGDKFLALAGDPRSWAQEDREHHVAKGWTETPLYTAPQGWMPIQSAPKMREILLWADTSTPEFPNWKMASGYYSTGLEAWVWGGETVQEWAFPPTHWQPLPPPPPTDNGGQ